MIEMSSLGTLEKSYMLLAQAGRRIDKGVNELATIVASRPTIPLSAVRARV